MTLRSRSNLGLLVAALLATAASCGTLGAGPDGGSGGAYPNGSGGAGPAGTSGGFGGHTSSEPITRTSNATPVGTPVDGPPAACVDRQMAGDTNIGLAVPGTRDMASAELARGAINLGASPDPGSVRPEEFLNHYRTRYPGPTMGEKIAIHGALVPTGVPREYMLQVGVEMPDVQTPRLKTSAVTVVVDTSVSMALGGDESGLARARAAVTAIAKALRPGDILNVITSGEANLPTPIAITAQGADDPAVQAAVDRLVAGGGNDLATAVADGYQLANAGFDPNKPGELRRVVLITDGLVDDADQVKVEVSSGYDKNDISLVGVGVGPAKIYDDSLLSAAALATHGTNLYLDSTDAADELLDLRFDEIMDVAAYSVQLTVDVPWFFEAGDLTGPGTSDDPTLLAGSDLGPGRSLIFRESLRICDESILTDNATVGFPIIVSWATSPSNPPMQDTANATVGSLLAGDPYPVIKATAILAYAEALRGASQDRMVHAHDLVIQAIKQSGANMDAELSEIQALIEADPIYLGTAK